MEKRIEDTRPIVGVKLLRGAPEAPARRYRSRRGRFGAGTIPPAESTHWVVTRDVDDFRLHDSEFIPASSHDDCRAALEARFPIAVPTPGVSRVKAIREESDFGPRVAIREESDFGPRTNSEYVTHVRPRRFVVHAYPYRTLDAADEDLLAAARVMSPILVAAGDVDGLRRSRHFDDDEFVFGDSGCPDYRLLKYDPAKARAVRKGEGTKLARARRESDLADLERRRKRDGRDVSHALIELAEAIRYDLARDHDLCRVLAAVETGPKAEVDVRELRAFVAVHEKYRGRKAYRRLPAWRELRARFAALPADVATSHWHDDPHDTEGVAWVIAEMKARPPRPEPVPEPGPAPVEEEYACLA